MDQTWEGSVEPMPEYQRSQRGMHRVCDEHALMLADSLSVCRQEPYVGNRPGLDLEMSFPVSISPISV